MPTMRQDDGISVLDLGDGENRLSLDWLATVDALLDAVLDRPEPTALITTGRGKFFSNGLDLDWLIANGDQVGSYLARVRALFSRFLTLPIPTVAAINGHAFGAGAMLAIAHDHRIMRVDRGYYCFPEVDIKLPFSPGMAHLVQAKLTPQAAVAAMTTGRRFGGPEAAALGLIDETATEGGLFAAAAAWVRPLAGKDRGTLGAIKSTMFAAVVAELRRPDVPST